MHANNTYGYFSMVLHSAPKNLSTCPNSCTSGSVPLEICTLFEKSHPTRTTRLCTYSAQPVSVPALKIHHSIARRHVAPRGWKNKTHERHTSGFKESFVHLAYSFFDNSVRVFLSYQFISFLSLRLSLHFTLYLFVHSCFSFSYFQ